MKVKKLLLGISSLAIPIITLLPLASCSASAQIAPPPITPPTTPPLPPTIDPNKLMIGENVARAYWDKEQPKLVFNDTNRAQLETYLKNQMHRFLFRTVTQGITINQIHFDQNDNSLRVSITEKKAPTIISKKLLGKYEYKGNNYNIWEVDTLDKIDYSVNGGMRYNNGGHAVGSRLFSQVFADFPNKNILKTTNTNLKFFYGVLVK